MFDQEILLNYALKLRKQQRSSLLNYNRFLLLVCEAPKKALNNLADEYNALYKDKDEHEMSKSRAIRILHGMNLNTSAKQQTICSAVWGESQKLAASIKAGKVPDWQAAVNSVPDYQYKERLLLLSVISQTGKLWNKELYNTILEFSSSSSADFVQLLIDESIKDETSKDEEIQKLHERIRQLHRDNQALRENFRDLAKDAVAEEREKFFAQLNDEENGCILDLMMLTQKGFDHMRLNHTAVPSEIKSAQTLVRYMRKFFTSYGVEPMASIGETMDISPKNLDELIYEGSPFTNSEEIKTVEVISTGWEIPEKNIIISYPKAKEKLQS